MAKIVIIGAGSHIFARHLITDILSYPELRDNTITLMDIAKEPLEFITTYARKLVTQNSFKTRIESTLDRREALEDADFVITTIQVGGSQATQADRDIVIKYGITPHVGDTIGPGGVFYGMRHVPVILDICHDMEKLCPDAWLINYTNPMAIITWSVNDYSNIKNVGLCHSVQGTSATLAKYIGAPVEEISYWVAGINHMAWFLEFKWQGKDAYPLLREKFKNPVVYSGADKDNWMIADIVRAEIFKAFGYYNTESSRHISEYVPYFRKKNCPELLEKYKLITFGRFAPEADRERIRKELAEKMRKDEDEEFKQQLASNYRFLLNHSPEYGSTIIHSIQTGTLSRIYGNVKNNGLITNLPQGCCVEVPCLVDKEGIHACFVEQLPPQLAALNRTNINEQEMAVRGIAEKDKTKIFQSILLDPLTAASLTIDETRQMVDELFRASAKYLKGYK